MGASRELQNRRIKAGQCPLCAKAWAGSTRWCLDCRKKYADFRKKYRDERRVLGLCSDCGKRVGVGKFRCDNCRAKVNRATSSLAIRRRKNGVCMWCGDKEVMCDKYKLCEECWFKRASLRVVGNFSLGKKLHKLYLSQDGRCFYTGVALKLGINTSLDHQNPRTRKGSHNIRNFRWVSVIVNRIKQNLTHKEFVSLCKLISSKF